eukprot:TRINITY_DN2195_c0_g1_i33.p1 TRINITY_DN2195_c0_g1~~TRINITY_DN2195_c0_g1_i33.p1  ORF type:complete len:729 (+),score=313.91 TRINITY_DN2195_c0_g1_i33:75-2261(+)
MIRRPPRSTLSSSSAASDVYKRQYQRRVRGRDLGNMADATAKSNEDMMARIEAMAQKLEARYVQFNQTRIQELEKRLARLQGALEDPDTRETAIQELQASREELASAHKVAAKHQGGGPPLRPRREEDESEREKEQKKIISDLALKLKAVEHELMGDVEEAQKLLAAAENGDLETLQEGLESCNSLRDKQTGKTLLMSAAASGQLAAVTAILAAGAEVDMADNNGKTALGYAARRARCEVVKLLVQSGASVDLADHLAERTPLMHAVVAGSVDCIIALTDAGANVNSDDSQGVSALMLAAMGGQLEAVRLLLQLGANESHLAKDGRTVLMFGVRHTEIIQILIDAGVDVLAWDQENSTAVDWAKWEDESLGAPSQQAVEVLEAAYTEALAHAETARVKAAEEAAAAKKKADELAAAEAAVVAAAAAEAAAEAARIAEEEAAVAKAAEEAAAAVAAEEAAVAAEAAAAKAAEEEAAAAALAEEAAAKAAEEAAAKAAEEEAAAAAAKVAAEEEAAKVAEEAAAAAAEEEAAAAAAAKVAAAEAAAAVAAAEAAATAAREAEEAAAVKAAEEQAAKAAEAAAAAAKIAQEEAAKAKAVEEEGAAAAQAAAAKAAEDAAAEAAAKRIADEIAATEEAAKVAEEAAARAAALVEEASAAAAAEEAANDLLLPRLTLLEKELGENQKGFLIEVRERVEALEILLDGDIAQGELEGRLRTLEEINEYWSKDALI